MTTQKARNTKQKMHCYTASEAARELEVSPTMVYLWLSDGTLEELTTLEGRMRLVSADSVFALKRKRKEAQK